MSIRALLYSDGSDGSSDSDFRIEDVEDSSSDIDISDDANKTENDSEESNADKTENHFEESKAVADQRDESDPLDIVKLEDIEAVQAGLDVIEEDAPDPILICGICLDDTSEGSNEIVECDGCGIAVHESCYGLDGDVMSASSTNSTYSKNPWFCELCQAGFSAPACELCPNTGGIYKVTDNDKWVHLICALYVPDAKFCDLEKLSIVTLSEMPHSKWGAKRCSLCEPNFAYTGICIGCDAGMCRTYFHVSCAQAEGLLVDARIDDADAVDPLYANCKIHSEKDVIGRLKGKYTNFCQQILRKKLLLDKKEPNPAQLRNERWLARYILKNASNMDLKSIDMGHIKKNPRAVTTSASTVRRFAAKIPAMQVDAEYIKLQAQKEAAMADVRNKEYVQPALSFEFVADYLHRIKRREEITKQLKELRDRNSVLLQEEDSTRKFYSEQLQRSSDLKLKQASLHSSINHLAYLVQELGAAAPTPPNTSKVGATDGSIKIAEAFSLAHLGSSLIDIDLTHAGLAARSGGAIPKTPSKRNQNLPFVECAICARDSDQHLLIKCDSCCQHYHLHCLDPPLMRLPKRTKTVGWQCSKCDKCDDCDASIVVPEGRRRRSRTQFTTDGSFQRVAMLERSSSSSRPVTQSTASPSGSRSPALIKF